MLLNEKLLKNLGRTYWRGSYYDTFDKTKSVFKYLYVSNSVYYAMTYANRYGGTFDKIQYLTQYVLSSRSNIFNARYPKDYQKLEEYCRQKDPHFLSELPELKDQDWARLLNKTEKEYLLDILQVLGYDGFFNIESFKGDIKRNTDLNDYNPDYQYGFSAIGLFDEGCVTQVKQYHGWKQIREIDEVKELTEIAKQDCEKLATTVYQERSELDEFEDFDELIESVISKICLTFSNVSMLLTAAEITEIVKNTLI